MKLHWQALANEYGKDKIEDLADQVGKFLTYKLQKPWWSVDPTNIVASEGGMDHLVFRGVTYILESEMNGVQTIDPMVDGLRRFSHILVTEYGNSIMENQAIRLSSLYQEYIPKEEEDGEPSFPPFGAEDSPIVGDLHNKLPTVAQNQAPFRGLQSDYSQKVSEALDQLTELERELFTTYATVNSIMELCELTGRNYNTVKPQISRIRKKLKALL